MFGTPLNLLTWVVTLVCICPNEAIGSCPSDDSRLTPWHPYSDPNRDVVIDHGMRYRLEKSVELRTIYIKNGGELVFKDGVEEILLSVNFIHIEKDGALYIGSESCRYQGKATILFRGKSYDKDFDLECGKKGLCVAGGGILEIHGKEKLSWTFLDKTLWKGEFENVITLEDDVSSWKVGDRIVISSTDNDMHHSEEFSIAHCSDCSKKQLKIHGTVKYNHYGDHYKGIDMRAEVGILTRNVRVRGDMESHCYGNNWCSFFSYDTFGGHLMFLRGFKRIRLEDFEVKHMGQQANLGRYPVHFHDCGDLANKKDYSDIAYIKGLSIHHCYNRCVTVHGTSSLTVSDVVGYDTLGHCFFLEDGNEQNNTFYHNLGLVTQASTLLPTDRNRRMCMAILGAVWPGYVPADSECTAVSTFWIAHPNNNFIENAAGGSEEAGFWFIFHEKPTGHGPGSLPPFQALRSPMGKFYKNRAHSSNYGVYVDNGVKPTEANKYKPQEYLARQMAEYMPHVKADPMKPRSPAHIQRLTAFKNNFGIRARGGDIYISESKFADNGNSVEFSSSKSFPYDTGSHQEVYDSVFVGQSDNGGHWSRRRRDTTQNFTVPSANLLEDVLQNDTDQLLKTHTEADMSLTHAGASMTGVEVLQGPVIIKNCKFHEFWAYNVGITFSPRTVGHMSPMSGVSKLKFGHHINRFSIGPYPKTDGDKTRILHDKDGSLMGYDDTYIMNKENWLTRHVGCQENWQCKCAVCKGKYGSLFIRANPGHHQTMKIWRYEAPDKPLSLNGIVMGSGAMQRVEYHPNVLRNKGYLLSWSWNLPHDIVLYPVAFDKGDFATIGLCIKDLHAFSVFWELEQKGCGNTSVIVASERYFEAQSMDELNSMRDQFYVDSETGMLFFNVKSRYTRNGYDYCSEKGCERLHFTYRGNSPMQDCFWNTFPKYKWTDIAGKTVPRLQKKKIVNHQVSGDLPARIKKPDVSRPTPSQPTSSQSSRRIASSRSTRGITSTQSRSTQRLSSKPATHQNPPAATSKTTNVQSTSTVRPKPPTTTKPTRQPKTAAEIAADSRNPYLSPKSPWRNTIVGQKSPYIYMNP